MNEPCLTLPTSLGPTPASGVWFLRLVFATLAVAAGGALAQTATKRCRRISTNPTGNLRSGDDGLPSDGVDITLLAEIVTKRLHIPILYDEQIRGKKVIIRVSGEGARKRADGHPPKRAAA